MRTCSVLCPSGLECSRKEQQETANAGLSAEELATLGLASRLAVPRTNSPTHGCSAAVESRNKKRNALLPFQHSASWHAQQVKVRCIDVARWGCMLCRTHPSTPLIQGARATDRSAANCGSHQTTANACTRVIQAGTTITPHNSCMQTECARGARWRMCQQRAAPGHNGERRTCAEDGPEGPKSSLLQQRTRHVLPTISAVCAGRHMPVRPGIASKC